MFFFFIFLSILRRIQSYYETCNLFKIFCITSVLWFLRWYFFSFVLNSFGFWIDLIFKLKKKSSNEKNARSIKYDIYAKIQTNQCDPHLSKSLSAKCLSWKRALITFDSVLFLFSAEGFFPWFTFFSFGYSYIIHVTFQNWCETNINSTD